MFIVELIGEIDWFYLFHLNTQLTRRRTKSESPHNLAYESPAPSSNMVEWK